jgi:hypothetical protein
VLDDRGPPVAVSIREWYSSIRDLAYHHQITRHSLYWDTCTSSMHASAVSTKPASDKALSSFSFSKVLDIPNALLAILCVSLVLLQSQWTAKHITLHERVNIFWPVWHSQSPVQMVLVTSPVVKQPGRGANHSSPSSAEVKNSYGAIGLPPPYF